MVIVSVFTNGNEWQDRRRRRRRTTRGFAKIGRQKTIDLSELLASDDPSC